MRVLFSVDLLLECLHISTRLVLMTTLDLNRRSMSVQLFLLLLLCFVCSSLLVENTYAYMYTYGYIYKN